MHSGEGVRLCVYPHADRTTNTSEAQSVLRIVDAGAIEKYIYRMDQQSCKLQLDK